MNDHDSESEDVVFEDSPLYQHLKETGFLDFECPTKECIVSSTRKTKCNNSKILNISRSVFNTIKSSTKRCWNAFCTVFLKDFQKLGCCARKEIVTFICNTKLLSDDDQAFLKNISSEFLEKYENYDLSSFSKWKFSDITTLSSYIIAGSFALLSWYISCNASISRSNVFKTFDKLVVIFIVIAIIGHSTHCFIYHHHKRNIQRNLTKLKELAEVSISIRCLAKKCICFIQESEIVARGFTFASLKVPAQRLELSSKVPLSSINRQCPELRENIFHWTRNMYYNYRQATVNIHQLLPLQPILDVPSHYLATVSLDEFGPLLKLDLNDENEKQELFEASDRFSISSIKSVFQLMKVQQSEFYRLFSLGFIPDALLEIEQDPSRAFNTFSQLLPFVEQLMEADQDMHSFLTITYNYYQSLEISHLLSKEKGLQSSSPYSEINLAVHSLNLHLRAALKRVYAAEVLMEQIEQNRSKSDTITEISHQIDLALSPCLSEVRSELDASKECLNETEDQISLLTGRKLPVDSLHISLPIKCQLPEIPESPAMPLSEVEPVIQDQVFEAFTEQVGREADNVIIKAEVEEKLKKQKEREASVHLLKELRSVLVTKAEEHKLREERALALMKGSDFKFSATYQPESSRRISAELEDRKESDSSIPDENSSDDSPQENQTDKSIETLRESDEIEKWELLSDKELSLSSNNNKHEETSLIQSSENIKSTETERQSNETLTDVNLNPILSGVSFNFGSSIASLAAERCRNLGLQMQTFSSEGDECFADDDDDDDDDGNDKDGTG